MEHFAIGELVVNLSSEVAVVVAHDRDMPVLKSVGRDLEPRGGRWVAMPILTRGLSHDEVVRFMGGGVIFR